MQPMMQAAAIALARERNWLASAMIHHYVEPLALEHRCNVKTLREGQQAAASLYRRLALGFRHRASFQMLARLLDPARLCECGILVDICLQKHEEALQDDPVVLEQNALAARLDALVFQLLRQRSVGAVQFSDTVLGIIATFAKGTVVPATGFSGPSSSEQRSAALRKLKKMTEVVDAAANQPSPIIRKWLQRSDSAKAVEKRILGFCKETNFDTWPDAAQLEVDHIFQAEPSTIIVENAFKELRAAEKGEKTIPAIVSKK